jgi:hypothetical protein
LLLEWRSGKGEGSWERGKEERRKGGKEERRKGGKEEKQGERTVLKTDASNASNAKNASNAQ